MNFLLKNSSIVVQYLLVSLVFGYIIIRANSLSFTHDEAFSYKFLIGADNPQVTANHHILNTNLMGVSKSLFGIDEFSLRFPNVLAFLFYALGYFLITSKTSIKHSWLLFTLYFLNPFVLDFFSLARGYGLSMGFISMSVYGLIRFTHAIDIKEYRNHLIIAFVFGSLALFANLSTINYCIAIWFYAVIIGKQYLDKNNKKELIQLSLIFILMLAVMGISISRLLYLKELNELYFGADSFFHTVNSLAADSLYGYKYPEYIYNTLRIAVYVFLAGGLLLLLTKLKKILKQDILLVFPIVLIGYLAENLLFKAQFPLGRTTLILYVLLLIYSAKYLSLVNNKNLNKIKNVVGFLLSTLVLVHFSKVANNETTANWKYDSKTSLVMQKIAEINTTQKISFSANWLFEPSVNYYIDLYKIDMKKIDRRGVNNESEYAYQFIKETDSTRFEILQEYPLPETNFLKKK